MTADGRSPGERGGERASCVVRHAAPTGPGGQVVRIDLHTHSRCSDGTQTPAELVHAAAAAGLDVLALTDHDTAAGWAEATRAAERGRPRRWSAGIEISTKHQGSGVHLLAYLPDPTYPPLVEQLDRVLDGRSSRVPAILERLRELGIDDRRRRRTPRRARDRRDRPPARRRRPGHARRGAATATRRSTATSTRAVPAYVDRYAAPLVEMLRVVERGRRGLASSRTRGAGTGRTGLDEATLGRAGRARPGRASRSTTRTTTRSDRERLRAIAREPRAGRHRAPATTTGSARSTTSSAATPPTRRSTSGSWSSRRPRPPGPGGTPRRSRADRLLPADRLEPLQHAAGDDPGHGGDRLVLRRRDRERPCPSRSP